MNLSNGTPTTILVPVGKKRELPEIALNVLRGLWSRLGYQGNSFIEMQIEINHELDKADFARFEREMLCNEIISLRQEMDIIKVDRNEQVRRVQVAQNELVHVIASEERTFKALVAEREISKRAIDQAEKGVNQVVIAKEKEAERAEAMSEEIHRLEKERLAAVLYARTAEEQAALANVTAKTAAAVAISAVQSHQSSSPHSLAFSSSTSPTSPAPMTYNNHRTSPRPHTPSLLRSSPSISRSSINNNLTESLSSINLNSSSRPQTPHLNTSTKLNQHNWNQVDAAIIASRLREKDVLDHLHHNNNRLNLSDPFPHEHDSTSAARLRFDLNPIINNTNSNNRRNNTPVIHTPKVTYQGLRN